MSKTRARGAVVEMLEDTVKPQSQTEAATDGLLDVPTTASTGDASTGNTGAETRLAPLSIEELLERNPSELTLRDVEACLASCDAKQAISAAEMMLGVASEMSLEALERTLDLALERARTGEDGLSEGEVSGRLRSTRNRLADWSAIYPPGAGGAPGTLPSSRGPEEGDGDVDLDDPWASGGDDEVADRDEDVDLNDPWADEKSESSVSELPAATPRPLPPSPPNETYDSGPSIDRSTFLIFPLTDLVTELARVGDVHAVRVMRHRHGQQLFPHRLAIISAFPAWYGPEELSEADVLPTCHGAKEVEWKSDVEDAETGTDTAEIARPAMAIEQVRGWYEGQIYALDLLGLVDTQTAWVRQATLKGVTGLDAIGEDLSLLSRLVYEASLSPQEQAIWTLSYWQEADSKSIVEAYLSGAQANDIIKRTQTMVLPYLHVLASRAERAGRPDKGLVERHLVDALLTLPLDLVLPVFEQSKATLPKAERIIQDDLVVARLALAILYGTDTTPSLPSAGEWATRSAIFECLPVWDISGRDPEDDAELTSTTLDSIAAFVRPSPTQPRPPCPADLMMFFAPLPFASLSRALDILDVHLESGEILARWDTPVEMRFLLQSARDAEEQTQLLKRMVTQASERKVDVKRRKAEDERWDGLWTDLLRLNGSGDQLLRGAFGMIDGADIMRVYLGGILRSGSESHLPAMLYDADGRL